MSYLKRLIERATDTNLDLENNKIGDYRITPQHGNVFVYHIYKEVFHHKFENYERHLFTITISEDTVYIVFSEDDILKKEFAEVYFIINDLYSIDKKISIKKF